MSKRTERRARRVEHIKRDIRSALVAALAGLVLLLLSGVGLLQGYLQLRAYQNSPELLTVSAEVTAVSLKTERDVYGSPHNAYEVRVKYAVNGQEYQGKLRLHALARKGEKRDVEVYRTAKGDYRIPEIRTRNELIAASLTPIIGGGVGTLLVVSGLVMALSGRRRLRRER